MSDADSGFVVERILARKLGENGDFHYLLKWEGYRQRTWEPRVNLNKCAMLLNEFELRQAKRAINVRRTPHGIEYLIEQKDDMPAAVVPAVEAAEKWPTLILNYLERMIQFVPDSNPNKNAITEFKDMVGDPMSITYVTNAGKGLKYWCEWPLHKGKFVDSAECLKEWPRKLQTFLESKLDHENPSLGLSIVTRQQRRLAAQFDRTYGVRIHRKINFDIALLQKASALVERRRTIGQSVDSMPYVPKSILYRRKSYAPPRSVTFSIPNASSNDVNLAPSVSIDPNVVASGAADGNLGPSVAVDRSVVASGAGDGNLAPSAPIDPNVVASGAADGNLAPSVAVYRSVIASGSADGNLVVLAPIDGNRVTSDANGGNPNVLNSSIQIGPPISGTNRAAVENRAPPTTSVAPGQSGILQLRTYLPSPARKSQSPAFTTKTILQKPN